MEEKLWYRHPADNFTKALPIGNGSFGAMVYGGYEEEKISLNSDTLWSGYPIKNRNLVEVSKETLEKVRADIFSGEYFGAEKLMKEKMLGSWNESYVAMADIRMKYLNPAALTNYRRELKLDRAIAASEMETPLRIIRTESFVSAKDNAFVMNITSEGEPLSVEITFESRLKYELLQGENGSLLLKGTAPSHVEPNYVPSDNPIVYDEKNKGIQFCVYGDIGETDGKILKQPNSIKVLEATRITVIVVTENGFRGYDNKLETSFEKLEELCRIHYKLLKNKLYPQLKENHIAEHAKLYDRVRFHLYEGCPMDQLPTDERLVRVKQGNKDKGLIELLFQYGRYLLICSSRDSTAFTQPANLQGIWCEDVRSVWGSNWTTNINIEMNYWLSGVCNLSECDIPLIKMMEDLMKAGNSTAEKTFHCPGFAVNHNVDLWRQTAQVGGEVKWAFWPMAGVWLCSHLYQHYLYTSDMEFLREKALPVMKSCAEFCLAWLVEGKDDYLHTCPSTSPENTFYDKNKRECSVSYSSTMDVALIKELFMNLSDVCEIFNTEAELRNQMKIALSKMPSYQIGKYGQLQEWIEDFDEIDSGHRHFAHLVAFHPFAQINSKDTPELVAAVEKTIERRIENRKINIGWNCAWLINFYARLGYGDRAEECLEQLLNYSIYDNLFDLHPPLEENDGEREIFQIDGNFGAAAGIAEMLLQSHLGTISLLPALPADWTKGKVTGLCARGGAEVDMEWDDGKIVNATIKPFSNGEIRLEYIKPFEVSQNDILIENSHWKEGNKYITSFFGEKSSIYVIIPKEISENGLY